MLEFSSRPPPTEIYPTLSTEARVTILFNVFVYGTLQSPEVFRRVTGRPLVARSASLPDYARYRLCGLCYPGVIAEIGVVTDGLLIEGLDPSELARLDAFEDDFYRRESLMIRTSSGERVMAEVYVIPPHQRDRIDPRPWSFDDFAPSEWADLPRRCRLADSEES
jgi:gamma-glutamylcyclotransferase (GGCT)/AIG2-like uncharacterized protein YtfP